MCHHHYHALQLDHTRVGYPPPHRSPRPRQGVQPEEAGVAASPGVLQAERQEDRHLPLLHQPAVRPARLHQGQKNSYSDKVTLFFATPMLDC